MADIITATDRLEFNSKLHPVTDLEAAPKMNFYDPNIEVPLVNRDQAEPGAIYAAGSFKGKNAGSGAAGTAPWFGPLLVASGLVEVVTASTSVVYTPAADLAFTAVDIDCYKGNAYLISVDDAVVDWTLNIEPNKPAIFDFTMEGLYAEPTDAVGAAAAHTTARAPICKGLTVTIATATVGVKRATIKLGNKLSSPDEQINATNGVAAPAIIDRDMEIELLFRLASVATKNWYNLISSGDVIRLVAAIGGTAGNIMTLQTFDMYASSEPDLQKNDGFHELLVTAKPKAGATAMSIKYT